MFAIADSRVEVALDEVVAHGARAATIMSSLVIEGDSEPPLRERVLARIRKSGLIVCGANGMGFYNFADGVWGCGFRTRSHRRGGNVAYISHSGSGMWAASSTARSASTSTWSCSTGRSSRSRWTSTSDMRSTCWALARWGAVHGNGAQSRGASCGAFAKALERGIPVVALKVGRTEFSARLTVSHSGAIAGQGRCLRRDLRPLRRAPRAGHGRARDHADPVRAAARTRRRRRWRRSTTRAASVSCSSTSRTTTTCHSRSSRPGPRGRWSPCSTLACPRSIRWTRGAPAARIST